MLGTIKEIASGIIKPLTSLVDELHTSGEEKGKIKAEILNIEANITEQTYGLVSQLLTSQEKVLIAEVAGKSWLQRNWRPMLMCEIMLLIAWKFGAYPFFRLKWPELPELEIPTVLWAMLGTGLNGYIALRTVEKGKGKGFSIVPNFKKLISRGKDE